MSDTKSEKGENVATTSNTVESQSDGSVATATAAAKAIRKIPVGKPGPKCRKMLADESHEEKSSNSSAGQTDEPKSSDVPGELEEMFGDLASSPQKKAEVSVNVTTENLLSVLEDDGVEKKSEPADKKTDQESASASKGAAPTGTTTLNGSLPTDVQKPPSAKRYVYKLKSKSGKVLKYTSNTPIVLKKPVINLTKMVEAEACDKGDTETADIDSDNSTKENNVKSNEASKENSAPPIVRKRGRPPLSQKTPSSVSASAAADERNSSELAGSGDAKDKTPSSSYGVQTRKRQLKFLPDGRLLTPSKKSKTDVEAASSSDSDVETASDPDPDPDSDFKINSPPSSVTKKSNAEKKTTAAAATPVEKKTPVTKKKPSDAENHLPEKTGSEARKANEKTNQSITPSNKTGEIGAKNNKSISSNPLLSTLHQQSSSSTAQTPPAKKITPVDPAQLLSSLIGVPITPSQLNIVKFKPKVIQERSSTAPTPKKVTIDDEKLKKMTPSGVASGGGGGGGGGADSFRNTPFKVVSKTTFQKILPKPSPLLQDRTPMMRRVEHRILPATATPLTYATIAPKISDFATTTATTPTMLCNNLNNSSSNDSSFTSKFDNFTDSKVVKTKGGPKKMLKRKLTSDGVGDESPKTVYDLLQHVFDQMPSWNLHVIPDTNHFCIAQVSRGRMGIPILKKSIELTGEFFAKVYVHQLHCKRYDGYYDTENKILALIREIDALAA